MRLQRNSWGVSTYVFTRVLCLNLGNIIGYLLRRIATLVTKLFQHSQFSLNYVLMNIGNIFVKYIVFVIVVEQMKITKINRVKVSPWNFTSFFFFFDWAMHMHKCSIWKEIYRLYFFDFNLAYWSKEWKNCTSVSIMQFGEYRTSLGKIW